MHMHILPNIDDGPKSIEESVYMLEIAYREGIRTIIATPHCGSRNPGFRMGDALEKLELLNAKCQEIHPDMRVLLGSEILYYPEIIEDIKVGRALTLNGSKYVLVEFMPKTDYEDMLNCVQQFNAEGYTPIFAHIERYNCLKYNEDRVKQFKKYGAMMQVNSEELTEKPEEKRISAKTTLVFNPKSISKDNTKRVAWEHVRSGLVDLIASDAHGDIFRTPVMGTALNKISEIAGEDTANRLILNAQKIAKL